MSSAMKVSLAAMARNITFNYNIQYYTLNTSHKVLYIDTETLCLEDLN